MSKFLAQSKTFLPMVMQKSTTDAMQILERYPSLSTAQHEELPKPEIQKQEMPEQEIQKKEPPKQDPPPLEQLHPEIIKQINAGPKDNLNIVLHKSSAIPSVGSCKIPEVGKIPLTALSNKNPESLKAVTVDSDTQKSLLKALILDLMQLQQSLVVLLSEGRLWLWLRVLSNQVGPSASGEFRVEKPQLKEREPVLLSVAPKKIESKSKQDEKGEEKPSVKSNLWEAIQEHSPSWQNSISSQLGELQKAVLEKLEKK